MCRPGELSSPVVLYVSLQKASDLLSTGSILPAPLCLGAGRTGEDGLETWWIRLQPFSAQDNTQPTDP